MRVSFLHTCIRHILRDEVKKHNPFTLFQPFSMIKVRKIMDSPQNQSDSDKDAHPPGAGTAATPGQPADNSLDNSESLENAGTETTSNTPASASATAAEIDATEGTGSSPSTPGSPPQKLSPLKRFWRKFNVYLLLFVLIILIAVGVTITLFIKDRSVNKQTENVISSQDLSDNTLKQLANSDVSVGNSKQVLKVESNAIFAGSVLVRNDLEVAGTIKVGSELQLPGLSVSGDSRFNQLQANNLTIGSNATIQGALVAKKGLAVSGSSTFDGPLSAAQISTNSFLLNGELKLTSHISAGGPTPNLNRGGAVGNGGTASVSGSDTTGSIVINTGSGPGAGCFATVFFARKFNSTPHVTITPVGSGAAGLNYYVNRSSSEFSVCVNNPAPAGQTFGFDYIILN